MVGISRVTSMFVPVENVEVMFPIFIIKVTAANEDVISKTARALFANLALFSANLSLVQNLKIEGLLVLKKR